MTVEFDHFSMLATTQRYQRHSLITQKDKRHSHQAEHLTQTKQNIETSRQPLGHATHLTGRSKHIFETLKLQVRLLRGGIGSKCNSPDVPGAWFHQEETPMCD